MLSDKFCFRKVTTAKDVAVQIQKLNSNTDSPINCIPVKIRKGNPDIFGAIIQNLYNSGLSKVLFMKNENRRCLPTVLKRRHIYKKGIIDLLQSYIRMKNLQKADTKSEVSLRPVFLILPPPPLLLSRRLWYAASTSKICGKLKEINGQRKHCRGCLHGPLRSLRLPIS